jgi:hypothetical protein
MGDVTGSCDELDGEAGYVWSLPGKCQAVAILKQ